MKSSVSSLLLLLAASTQVDGYAFVSRPQSNVLQRNRSPFDNRSTSCSRTTTTSSTSTLRMVDEQVLMGAGIAVAGLAAGIGLVAFTENQGERARERGSGLSEGMSTRLAGGLLEDVEVSSVDDIGSLTSQLEKALKEKTGADEKQFEMTEEDKKRLKEEADDGW